MALCVLLCVLFNIRFVRAIFADNAPELCYPSMTSEFANITDTAHGSIGSLPTTNGLRTTDDKGTTASNSHSLSTETETDDAISVPSGVPTSQIPYLAPPLKLMNNTTESADEPQH